MQSHSEPSRYAPASVGVLVDPGFLRGAVRDAHGDRHSEVGSSSVLRSQWKAMLGAILLAIRRR